MQFEKQGKVEFQTHETPILYCWLRALMQFKDVPLRTRRVLSLYKLYGDSALLVLNGTVMNRINTLLALSRQYIVWVMSCLFRVCIVCQIFKDLKLMTKSVSSMIRWQMNEGCQKFELSIPSRRPQRTPLHNNVTPFYVICVTSSAEKQGRYCCSTMFRWEPERCYRHRLCTAIPPFWFSTEHHWIVIAPFWLSTNDLMHIVYT